jgi:hypothetical protein
MKAILTAVWCCLVLLGSTCGSAHAQEPKPFKATDYPIAVRKVLSSAVLECRQQEGGQVEFALDTVRRVDFNGDGRGDYVVSFEKIRCPNMEHIFCGTGGCFTNFLVTLPNGTIRSLFADTIHEYEMLKGRPRQVRFRIHHSYCEDGHTKGCYRVVRISYRPFTPMRS